MNPTESPLDEGAEPADLRLRALFQTADLPVAPDLELATRLRIEQHARPRIVALAALCLAVVLGGVLMLPRQEPELALPQQVPAKPLNEQELASLFALPPVEPLTLLERQQQVSFQTLKQWERSQ